MKVQQAILDQLPANAADALTGAGSVWDTFVGNLSPTTQVIAIVVTREGARKVLTPEAQAKWRAMKEVLHRMDADAHEDETVDLYRALPARERAIVDDLVRALHGRR